MDHEIKRSDLISLEHIREARERIRGMVHQTPVQVHASLNADFGAELFFKAEHLQKGGAFKARGAHHALSRLSPELLANGVATHSSGNHGAALALAARRFNTRAFVVMPTNAPAPKRAATLAYGAEVIDCEPTLSAREAALIRCVNATGATFVPPYDHPDIIAGQGTAGLELFEQIGPVDLVLVPVGGGGLLAGVSAAMKALSPQTQVIGVEPVGADDAYRSFYSGKRVTEHQPDTIADGLRTTLGVLNFDLIRRHVDAIVTVDDTAICKAMALYMTRAKEVVEPSGVIGLAAIMAGVVDVRTKRVAIILSGGNVDLTRLPW